jgi:hypothetical protein
MVRQRYFQVSGKSYKGSVVEVVTSKAPAWRVDQDFRQVIR